MKNNNTGSAEDNGGPPTGVTEADVQVMTESQVRITMHPRVSLTIPHKAPATTTVSLGKRQLASLPSFTCISYIANPESVVAGCSNGKVIYWRVPQQKRSGSYEEHMVLGAHKGRVTCVAFQDQHRLFVTGSSDNNLKVWDALGGEIAYGQGRCIQTLCAHDATISCVSSHCNLILSGSVDKTLKVWRFEEGRDAMCFPWLAVKQVFVFDNWISSLWTSLRKIPESSQGEIYVGDAAGSITVLRSIMQQADDVTNALFASHIELVRQVKSEARHSIVRVLPIPNLNMCISLSFEEHARIHDLTTFQTLVTISHPENEKGKRFLDVAWDAQHEEVVLLDECGKLFLWESKSNRVTASAFAGCDATALFCLPPISSEDVLTSRFAVGPSMWVAHREAVINIVVERTSSFVEHIGHTGRVIAVKLNPHTASQDLVDEGIDYYFVSASVDNTICLWSHNMMCLKTFTEKQSEITCFTTLTSTHRWLISGHDNGTLKFWTLGKDKPFRFSAHENTVTYVGEGFHRFIKGNFELCPHTFTVSFDGCLAVWDMPLEGTKAKCEARLRVSNSELVTAAYDNIKYMYIVGSNDGDVSMWSVDELKPMGALRGVGSSLRSSLAHSEAVTCLGLDGNSCFTGGEDEKLFMWNTVTGEKMKSFALEVDQRQGRLGEIQQFVVSPVTGNLLTCTRSGFLLEFSQVTGLATRYYQLQHEVSCIEVNHSTNEVVAGLDSGVILRIHLSMLNEIIPTAEEEE